MREQIKLLKKILLNCLWLILAISCGQLEKNDAVLPFYISPDFTPHWLDVERLDDEIHRIADFAFLNQNGDTVSSKTFAGKIYIADFIFTTCPGICPKMTQNMVEIQKLFANDDEVLLLSHSVTPEMDSVAVLKKYASGKGVIDGKWHLVTGERKAIYDIARKSYFADEDLGFRKTENDFLHTENFILVDKQRRIRGVYNGTLPAEVQRLAEDIAILKKEG